MNLVSKYIFNFILKESGEAPNWAVYSAGLLLTILSTFLSTLVFDLGTKAVAQFVEEPYKLSISWQHTHDDDMPSLSTLNAEWNSVCDSFGNEFSAPSLGWGAGVFSGFNCLKAGVKSGADKDALRLVVSDSLKKLTITLRGKGQNSGIQSKIVLPGSDKSVLVFRNHNLLASVVAYLVDSLPMAIRVTEKNYNPETKTIDFSFPTAIENPEKIEYPKTIVLYKLGWDRRFKLWRARKLTEANELKVKVEKGHKVLHQKELTKSKVQLTWNVVDTEKISLSAGTVWAHHAKGPGKRKAKIKAEIKKLLLQIDTDSVYDYIKDKGILASLLTAPFDSAYIGVRFGMPLLKGALYSEQTRFVGVLAEIRSGWFDGFKFNVDLWPKVTEEITDGGQIGEFEGSRYIVSWSFRIELPWFADSIDFEPAIGQWSFKIDLPLEGEVAPFEAKNALSFGLGIGLEWTAPSYILRVWGSRDLGVNISKVAGASNVTTLRAGVDFMHKIFNFKIGTKELTFSGLGFVGYDDITLNKSGEPDAEDTAGFIDSINYVQAYAGGGFSMSW